VKLGRQPHFSSAQFVQCAPHRVSQIDPTFIENKQLKDGIIFHLTRLVFLHFRAKLEITPFNLNVVWCFANKHTKYVLLKDKINVIRYMSDSC